MKIMRTFGFILMLAILGCSQAYKGMSLEHQAYEFVFNEIFQNASGQILISDKYSLGRAGGKTAEELREKYKDLKEFPLALLRRLVESDKDVEKVDWRPILVSSKFISIALEKGRDRFEFWNDFKAKYAENGGYYSVSRAIVDEDKKEAVLLYSFHCAVLCGAHDSIVYLKKYGMEWRIVSGTRLWIS